MTTSNELYVWTWLPGGTEPVVAGRVEQIGSLVTFIYGLNYRSRPDAISLFAPELPLRPGVQEPADGLSIAGVLRDGSPDRWGRGVIERRRNVAPGGHDAGHQPWRSTP